MELEDHLRSFLKDRFRGYEDDISIDDDLSDVVDSLGVFELVEFVEREFDVRVPTEQFSIDKFSSIRRILDFVDELRTDGGLGMRPGA